MFCSPLAPGQTHLQLRVYFLNNTPCALQWAIANEQPHGGRMRGPCQLFDFTGARADQCLKLKYISEGEGSGPRQVRDRKVDEREVQSAAFWKSRIPKFISWTWVPNGLGRTSWLCSLFLCLPLSPCQPAIPEQRDARREAGSERNLGLRIVF